MKKLETGSQLVTFFSNSATKYKVALCYFNNVTNNDLMFIEIKIWL